MTAGAFDLSDVDAELERTALRKSLHEKELRRSREIARRAFAQGFTAALEDGNASEWLDYYDGIANDVDDSNEGVCNDTGYPVNGNVFSTMPLVRGG